MRYFCLLLAALSGCFFMSCASSFTEGEKSVIRSGEGDIMTLVTIRSDKDVRSILRKIAKPLSRKLLATDAYKDLRRRMLATVQDPKDEGVGIAAPQVGISRSVIAVQRYDKPGEPFEMYINPKILSYGDSSAVGMEGCLSIPGIYAKVRRAQSIRLRYRDEQYRLHTEEVKGFTAVIFQHEVDHINGILYTDRMIPGSEILENERQRE